ncbi:hypothetical protein [Mycolicibacterium fortuitum]|uniref:hypothetical protein n=1 Tax=Mycolicibacterium fortuitum TaxID=1766 RepID=UPI0007EAE951|nr:hypothetical protein [Mycolicibacterium fortuitum]OBB22075.1 hypothetical protein A5763_03900 [Mycolicibacterium fortuitum]OBB43456.1 hypothetical protein A5754_01695 [Mycolicibacterium fortuitum]OBB56897.1 hypothetical protein A5755_27515 [Mycolicibacterium fortuitum]OBF86467.1 hypothetical protein A5751_08455 [Mycolicibacterium fortuitum]OBG11365.1 hypothetical protein A5768_12690 [Mycolicibacterium fortuitum]
MDFGQSADDEVFATVGRRVFTVGSFVGLLERYRAAMVSEGSGELLVRFFEDKPDTVPIPYPQPGMALRGLSHVPDAELVLNVQYIAETGALTAIAVSPDGTGTVFLGNSDEPIVRVPEGFRRLPLMHLVMTKIACGAALPAGDDAVVWEWLLCSAVTTVADELSNVSFDNASEAVVCADDRLRAGIRDRIAALKPMDGVPSQLHPVSYDWPALNEWASFLGAVDWTDVDDETFAVARGSSADDGKWWTAQGLANLELMSLPHVQDSLDRLESRHPGVGGHLRRAADAYAERVHSVSVSNNDRLRVRWRADDPTVLTRFVRKVVADTEFPLGLALVGYRRRKGRLQQLCRFDSLEDEGGQHSLDPTSIESIGPADGVVLIARSDAGWTASVLNREHESGEATSDRPGVEFLAALPEGELLAMLRRVLFGRARVHPVGAPHEWLCRRVLYGVALTLETGKVDGQHGSEAPSSDEQRLANLEKVAKHESPMCLLIDAALTAVIIEHVDPFVRALSSGPSLKAVRDEKLSDDAHWQTIAEVMEVVRDLDWSHVNVDPLAEAWGQPVAEARWWGAEGIAYRQARRIPEPTESLLRCAFVIGRGAGPSIAMQHLIDRTKQVFGGDVAVLWDLLPEFDT